MRTSTSAPPGLPSPPCLGHQSGQRRRSPRRGPRLAVSAVVAGLLLALVGGDGPVFADDGSQQLAKVIDNARLWVVGILVAVATFFLVASAVRYLASGGEPGEVEKAKSGFKSAAIGYAVAVLAPVLMTALKSIVGG